MTSVDVQITEIGEDVSPTKAEEFRKATIAQLTGTAKPGDKTAGQILAEMLTERKRQETAP